MSARLITQILERLAAEIPSPTTELVYSSNFELLVAVILSARTTDQIVNRITAQLFKQANTPEKILALGLDNLQKLISSSGFYRQKARHLLQTCEILRDKFQSQVPNQRNELESLPGVGIKTASVVLNQAFHQPTIAVDTHVFRVANRLEIARGKTPHAVAQILPEIIPPRFRSIAGNLLLLHGRRTCKSRHPHCTQCSLNSLCPSRSKFAPI